MTAHARLQVLEDAHGIYLLSAHHAPQVVYPVRRAVLQAILAGVVWLFSLTLLAVWCGGSPGLSWRTTLLVFFLAVTGAAIVWRVRHQGAGRLYWDGANWNWQASGMRMGSAVVSLTAVADFQRLIIVSLTIENGRQVWMGLHRSDFPERWLDCRRAIYLPGRPVAIPEPAGMAPVQALRPVAALEAVDKSNRAWPRFDQ